MECRTALEGQLRRQADWLGESWLWLLRTKVLPVTGPRPAALDVGCGPGYVMEAFAKELGLGVEGVDRDPDMVEACRARGLKALRAEAAGLPFPDESFPIVYCTFLLLWAPEPVRVLRELRRVSSEWVLCLAEPDYGGRLDYPGGLEGLGNILAGGLQKEGADPYIGRKLRSLFSESGLRAEVGLHPGVWELERLKRERAEEWRNVASSARLLGIERDQLESYRGKWHEALERGTLFQFNPVFYALARK